MSCQRQIGFVRYTDYRILCKCVFAYFGYFYKFQHILVKGLHYEPSRDLTSRAYMQSKRNYNLLGFARFRLVSIDFLMFVPILKGRMYSEKIVPTWIVYYPGIFIYRRKHFVLSSLREKCYVREKMSNKSAC